jgi:hypothetical protein
MDQTRIDEIIALLESLETELTTAGDVDKETPAYHAAANRIAEAVEELIFVA